jgi:hypothetical protein
MEAARLIPEQARMCMHAAHQDDISGEGGKGDQRDCEEGV